ncbi:MAG: peptidylprolyl isomerase [Candidatus Thorarchaeota archaeon]
MGVKIGDVVMIDYILYDEDNTFIDSSEFSNGAPLKIQIGAGQVIRGLGNSIIGMEVGEKKEISLDPKEAFGEFDPILLEKVPRSQFPEDIKIGEKIDFVGANGMTSPAWIRLFENDFVIIDMNPPLAGKRIKFVIKLIQTNLEPDPIPNPFYIGMSCELDCHHEHKHSN